MGTPGQNKDDTIALIKPIQRDNYTITWQVAHGVWCQYNPSCHKGLIDGCT